MNAGHVSGQCIRRDSNPHWTEFETASSSSWDTDAKWAGWVPGPPPPKGTGFTVRRVCRFAAGPDDVFAQKPACAACNRGHQGKKEPAAGYATGSSFILYTGGPSFRPLGPHTGRFRKRSMLLLFSRTKTSPAPKGTGMIRASLNTQHALPSWFLPPLFFCTHLTT